MMAAASADLPLDALIDEMMIDGIYDTQARLYEPRIVRLVCDMDYTSGVEDKIRFYTPCRGSSAGRAMD